MIYAVIDTNVVVSAILSDLKTSVSPPWKVMRYIFSGEVTPVVNEDILAEYEDVLMRRKFHFDADIVRTMLAEIRRMGIRMDPVDTGEDFPDEDDAIFFEIAMAVKEKHARSFLVTGNTKHFPRHPMVVTPTEFVRLLERNL